MAQIAGKGSKLRIVLFGTLHLEQDSKIRAVKSVKSRLLLSYIALFNGHMHAREKLAGITWPDTSQEQAKVNLRHALSEIRKELGPVAHAALCTEHGTVMLSSIEVETDLEVIRGLLRRGDPDSVDKAFDVGNGELLEGVDELWAVTEREYWDSALREGGNTQSAIFWLAVRPRKLSNWAENCSGGNAQMNKPIGCFLRHMRSDTMSWL